MALVKLAVREDVAWEGEAWRLSWLGTLTKSLPGSGKCLNGARGPVLRPPDCSPTHNPEYRTPATQFPSLKPGRYFDSVPRHALKSARATPKGRDGSSCRARGLTPWSRYYE